MLNWCDGVIVMTEVVVVRWWNSLGCYLWMAVCSGGIRRKWCMLLLMIPMPVTKNRMCSALVSTLNLVRFCSRC